MSKLILSLTDLAVVSFETVPPGGQGLGTVHAHQTDDRCPPPPTNNPLCPTRGPTCEHAHTCGNTCLGGDHCDRKPA